jgi:hypothetical protein
MAGFFAAFSTSSSSNSMGAAASTGQQLSATDYESLAMTLSPTTRSRLPDTSTALSLMEDFESLSLSDNNGTTSTQCCQCEKGVQAAAQVNVHESIEKNMNEQPFIYRKRLYCSLDCFFDAYVKQPGLCMWIDSLFSAAVKIKQAQMHAMDGGGSKSSSSFNHK